jgi:hypothetical protein
MTIQFNCPNCHELIAFADKHRGKRAHCATCGQRFVIPLVSDQTPKKIKPAEKKAEPLPGFYRAVFIDNWKLFAGARNVTGLVLVAAAVCFKFFAGHTDYSWTFGEFRFQAPTGLVITLAAWGCLFWYYMEVISSTALDVEGLPDVYMGGFFGFIWNVTVSLFVFAMLMIVVLLPSIIYRAVSTRTDAVWYVLVHVGLFIFPMAILTYSVGRDIGLVFRLDYMLRPIAKALGPYLVVFGLFALTWELQLRTVGYGRLADRGNTVIALHLLANLAVQMIAIMTMRSIGLFYRHYSGYFRW